MQLDEDLAYTGPEHGIHFSVSGSTTFRRERELRSAHALYVTRGGSLDLTDFASAFDKKFGPVENLRRARSLITINGNNVPALDIICNGVYAALLKLVPEERHPDKDHAWRLKETLLITGKTYG